MKIYVLLSCLLLAVCFNALSKGKIGKPYKPKYTKSSKKLNDLFKRASCTDINWATWTNFTGTNATGTINNGGDVVNVNMTANYSFDSTPQIYNHPKFSTYPSPVPNTTVPRTTWAIGAGGATTMCFSKTVTNPVLLLASLGSSSGIRATLKFSIPYVVIFDGGNMEYSDSKTITGTEGFAIIMFPGDFNCVTINSTSYEYYTNITWGLKPQTFPITISEDEKTCGSIKLTATGGLSYLWNGGDTPNSATNTFHQSGTYVITVTDANGCKNSMSKELNVTNDLTIGITGTTSACNNAVLTASGGLTYEWDGGLTPSSATNIFTQSGTYSVKVTGANNCSATKSITVEIYPEPTIAFAGTDISLCATGSTILDANAPNNFETGTWSVISPAGYNPFDALNINDPKANIQNIPENTDVVLQWTINQNICGGQSSSQVHLFNYGMPAVTLPPFITINEGQLLPISSSIVGASNVNYTYLWSPIDFLDDSNSPSPTVSPEETSMYKLTVSYGTCSLEKEIKIIVNKAKRLAICGGGSFMLSGAVDNDSHSIYQWQELISGNWTDIANANTESYNLNVPENFGNNSVDYEYRRKVVNAPYYDSRYIITVVPKTNNNIITTVKTNYCETEVQNLTLQGSVPNGASSTTITYKWQQSLDGITWQDLVGANKDLTVASITKNTFFRRVTYANLCESFSNEIKIQLFEPRTISYAGTNTSLCNATHFTLNASTVQSNEIGTWFVISPTNYQPFDANSINNPKATIENLPQNQPIKLKWSINNYNCGGSSSSDFTLISYKDITISGNKNYTINLGDKIEIKTTTDLAPEVPYTIDWSPKIGLNRYDILNPVASPTEHTNYTLTINYGGHCFNTFSTNITVLKRVEISNSFTPNADGINDKWEIKNLSYYVGSVVTVYNRYGTIVYQTYTNDAWDGTHKGNKLPSGVYYYVIKLNGLEKSVLSGSLTLLQ